MAKIGCTWSSNVDDEARNRLSHFQLGDEASANHYPISNTDIKASKNRCVTLNASDEVAEIHVHDFKCR